MSEENQAGGLADEFASVTVILDHLANANDDSGHVNVPTILSTETAYEALISQVKYFGQADLLLDADNLQVLNAGLDADCIYFYNVDGVPGRAPQTQCIVDADVWDGIINHPLFGNGTMLGACTFLVQSAKSFSDSGATFSVFVPDLAGASQDLAKQFADAQD